MSLIRIISKNKAEILCGGRHQIFKEILDDLFSRLSKIADLVFFLDGVIQDSKKLTWAARQNQKYMNDLKLLDCIYQNKPLNLLVKDQKEIHTNTLLNIIEASCQQFGQFHYAVKLECDQEIAQFAYNNKRVLAIFSNDSDFLIFPGHFRYWSTRDLNFSTLSTKEYNRQELMKTLKLSNFQLAIFATLAGNDIIPHDQVLFFLSNFGKDVKKRFPALAQYIKKNFIGKANHEEVLSFMGKEIFGKVNQAVLSRINDSINSYRVNFKLKEDNENSELNSLLRNHNVFTHNVLTGSPVNFSLVFYDLRRQDIPNYYKLAVPMFQRQAGIVLIHSGLSVMPRIYTKSSHFGKYRQEFVPKIFPPFEVPLLNELLSDDPQFDDDRFNLLKWTLNWEERLKDFPIQNIPGNYMISVLTLAYLKHNEAITDKEADIFLWTIKNAERNLIPYFIQLPEVCDHRAFRLAFLFVRMFANVGRSIEVCGLKKRYWVRF